MRKLTAAATTAMLLSATGCSFSFGSHDVSSDELERKISAGLERKVGHRPDSLDCPEPLDAKVGAKTRCVLTAGETKIGVTVTATAVDGNDVRFEFAVDEQPMS